MTERKKLILALTAIFTLNILLLATVSPSR